MKKYILSIFAFICCLFVTGCSTVTSSVKLRIQPDGSLIVEQSVAVNFDEALIKSTLFSVESDKDAKYEELMENVLVEAQGYMDALHYEYNSRKAEYLTNPKLRKYYGIFSTAYNEDIYRTETGFFAYRQFPTVYDFLLYNDYDIFYIGCPLCEEKIAETESEAKLLNVCPNCNESINYLDGDIKIEYDYYPYSRIVDFPFSGEVTTEEKNFYTEYSQEILTTYKDLLSITNKNNDPLVGKFEYMFSNGSASYSLDDVKLKFQFITPYSRVHSNGTVKRSGGYFVHTWDIGDIGGSVILYRDSANISAWYIVALTVSIGITLVLLLFGVVKNKMYENAKKKAKKDTHNNLIDIIR